MFFLLGLSIALAALLTFNSLASVLASLLWRLLGRPAKRMSAANRAGLVFLLRILPVAAGLACVTLLLAPAYLEHEPREAHEDISAQLAAIAFISAVGLSLALYRGFAAWRATARLEADWRKHATPVQLPNVGIRAFRFEHKFPVIAVVGIFRPRLFIADQIFNSLSQAELLAAISHEAGHIFSNDNLKRGLLRACRDVLLMIPCGRSLDQAWVEASETAADEFAARRGERTALDLASALVKIARLVPSGVRPLMPAGAFLLGTDKEAGVKNRVRRLMQLAKERRDGKAGRSYHLPLTIPIVLTILLVGASATEPHVLATVHWMMEHAVDALQ